MKSILWKEYMEHRYYFLILALFGLCALLVLKQYNSLDSGTILFVLFIFAGPTFSLLIGMHMITIENMHNTFPLLAMLPISRSRLWWSKVLFSTLFCASLYLVYVLLSLLVNASVLGFDVFNFYHANLPKFPFTFIFFSLPAVFLSLGLFVTMLPNIPVMIILGGFSGFLVMLLFSQGIYFYNIHLMFFLLTVSFLVSSRWAFLKGEMMDSLKPAFWGLGALTVCMILSISIWTGLDALSNRSLTITRWGKLFHRPLLESETSVIFTAPSSPRWWDPIQEHHMRTLRLDTRSGKLEPIGNRLMYSSAISPNRRYLASFREYPALFPVQQFGVVLIDLLDNNRFVKIDDEGIPIGFTPKGDLVYSRYTSGKTPVTELCYHQMGSGTKVIDARPSDSYGGKFVLPTQNFILYNIKKPDTRAMIVNLGDFTTKRLDVHTNLLPMGHIGSSTLLVARRTEDSASASHFLLDGAGELSAADWIPGSTKFIGNSADGNGLGLLPSREPPVSSWTEPMDLVFLDGANKSARIIATLGSFPYDGDPEVDTAGQWVIFQSSLDDPNVMSKLRLPDGPVEKFQSPFPYVREISAIGPGIFLLRVDNTIWTLDLKTMEFRKLTDI